jgi:hypothetical protein
VGREGGEGAAPEPKPKAEPKAAGKRRARRDGAASAEISLASGERIDPEFQGEWNDERTLDTLGGEESSSGSDSTEVGEANEEPETPPKTARGRPNKGPYKGIDVNSNGSKTSAESTMEAVLTELQNMKMEMKTLKAQQVVGGVGAISEVGGPQNVAAMGALGLAAGDPM